MHAKSAHRSRHAHHHHHHKQPSLPNETENNTITSTTTATTTDGNMATTKEIDDNNTSNTIVGESAKCMHHRSSVSHAHHHQHHIKQHSTTALGHNHAPHHHHHHHHNHHGRHHHHHQNHKKRLVLDTRDNESNEQQQNPDTDASNVNVVDVQQQQDEGDTQFSVNQLRNSIKDGPTTEVLGDEVDGDTDRQPMQELNSNVHTHCCPYHERHAACQHHVGQSTGHEHSKHHHHPHHHHHHHHHHGHQDQKKSASTTDQHQQLSLNKGLNHKHHHHHHHHHGHHHGTSGGGTKQRYGRNKVKNSSNSNLNEQDHSTVISAHQHHHHHHHPHHHHHHHRHQQQAQEIGVVGQEELLTNKGASFDAQHSMQKQDLEPITNGDEDAHNSTNNITSNCDHPFGNKLTKKGREENADDDDEVESKMNLDQDDRDDGGVNEEGRMQDLQQTIVTTNTTKNANNINAETNKNGSSDEVVRMDMTLNNEGCTRLISDNEASTSKKITESQTNEFQNLINSIDVEVSQPILQQVSSLANKSNLKSATNTKTNDANEMLMINGNHQKPTQIIQQAKDSDASAINGGESTSNKNRQTSHNEFSQNQEGDSKRGKNAEQQDRRVVRQTSSSRENSQKDTGGAKRQEQQLAECSPIHSESYQQQSQQTDQPKQIIEYTVPPDRRCRLCWCCCCPCSGLSNKTSAIKATDSKSAVEPPPSNSKCPSSTNSSVPLEEIRLWGESFDRLMRCDAGRKVFQDFLRCEYSEENILFWIACEELKTEKDAKSVATRARDIYEDYISILSAKEVSLDSRVRDVINNNIKKPTSNIFDEAQLQIYTLMHRDSYPRFINSPMYKKLAQIQTTSRKGST